MEQNFIIPCAFGLESVLADELRALGFRKPRAVDGRMRVAGELSDIATLNLSLRTAERVLFEVLEISAANFDELFESVKAFPWRDYLPSNASFPVTAKSVRSQLKSIPAVQRCVKKAVAESLLATYSELPEDGPLYPIDVSIDHDRASISLDTTGDALHKRGYRTATVEAPMKETLAAGILLLAGWKGEGILLDPFCGSGTLLSEGYLLATNTAPGLKRGFLSEEWSFVPRDLFASAREKALAAVRPLTGELFGSDKVSEAVRAARQNLSSLGARAVPVDIQNFLESELPAERGLLVTNPPYGERIGDSREVQLLARKFGELIRKNEQWSFAILTGDAAFEKNARTRASKKRKLYNGKIRTDLYQFT